MNKITSLSLLAIAAVTVGCSDIDESERFIDIPAVEAKRVVLIEEYTGQKCVNCPDGHKEVEKLLEQYPANLIAVSIHGGGDAWSYHQDKTSFGLGNDDSWAYAAEAEIYSYPSAIVNRNTEPLITSSWATEVRNALEKPSYLDMNISAKPSDDNSEIAIDVDIESHEILQGYLQVWVVESNIVARQLLSDGSRDNNYVHNHVLRIAVNGHNGEEVKLPAREHTLKTYQQKVSEKWNVANLSVVGFVYNNSGVLQAAQAKVVNN